MVLLCVAGCSNQSGGNDDPAGSQGSETPVTENKDPIRIGLSTPITGSQAENGVGTQAAVEIAVEEINAAGGINGRPVELVIQDSKSDPT